VFQHSFGLLQVIVTYEEVSETEKDAFYQALDNLYYSQCPTQPTVILGNFNAISGTDKKPCQRVVGPY